MTAEVDHVLVQISLSAPGLARQGFGIPMIPSHNADFVGRTKRYSTLAAVGVDWPSTSPEYRCARAIFAQTPKPRAVVIARMTGTVTQRYDIEIVEAVVGQEYAIDVVGEDVTDTTVSYTPAADLTFIDAEVDTVDDEIRVDDHGEETGAGPYRLKNAGGALPTPLAVDTNYWLIVVDDDTVKLATSRANAIANTPINITAAAGGGTHTLVRAQNDVICAQLVQGLNDVVGMNYLATQVSGAGETDTVRVTGSAAGNWFSLEINSLDALAIAQTHAAPSDVTLADDLDAVLLADASWYCVVPLYCSGPYLLDLTAWVEANDRIAIFDTVDSEVVTTALSGATDIGAQLHAFGYARSMGNYHHSPAEFLSGAIAGRWLSTDPGRAVPKFKTLSGITPSILNDTHKFNLRGDPDTLVGGRRMNAYEQVLADRPFFWEGMVFSTTYGFIDVTRNSDWLRDGGTKRLLGVFVGNDIVPYTPEGITMLEGAARGFFRGEAVAQGVLAPTPSVEAVPIEDVPAEDKAARNYKGLSVEGTFAGAIHKAIPVTVVLTL